MIFFDFIYYRFCNWYKGYKVNQSSYKIDGLLLLSAFINLNVVALIVLLERFFDIYLVSNKYETLYYSIPMCLPFVIRYWSGQKYEEVQTKVYAMSSNKGIWLTTFMVTYIIISLITVVYIVYLSLGK